MTSHTSAKPSHYDQEAKYYDEFNESNSRVINRFLEKSLKSYQSKTVLDLACGTGSQLFWLANRGFDVTGCDINANMLKIARYKARKRKMDIQLIKGDMRTTYAGEFDAVITIFNAIGHLTRHDFEKALRNIHRNLKRGGIYLFDIFNLNYLIKNDRITTLTIDWLKHTGKTRVREIQYSTINQHGILASYTTSISWTNHGKPAKSTHSQTLQIYTAKQLREILPRNGFKVIRQCGIDGSRFSDNKTERFITIAAKR